MVRRQTGGSPGHLLRRMAPVCPPPELALVPVLAPALLRRPRRGPLLLCPLPTHSFRTHALTPPRPPPPPLALALALSWRGVTEEECSVAAAPAPPLPWSPSTVPPGRRERLGPRWGGSEILRGRSRSQSAENPPRACRVVMRGGDDESGMMRG